MSFLANIAAVLSIIASMISIGSMIHMKLGKKK